MESSVCTRSGRAVCVCLSVLVYVFPQRRVPVSLVQLLRHRTIINSSSPLITITHPRPAPKSGLTVSAPLARCCLPRSLRVLSGREGL